VHSTQNVSEPGRPGLRHREWRRKEGCRGKGGAQGMSGLRISVCAMAFAVFPSLRVPRLVGCLLIFVSVTVKEARRYFATPVHKFY
jgi:hypothetical protein